MKISTCTKTPDHGPYWGETLYRIRKLYEDAPEGLYHPVSFEDEGGIIPDEDVVIIVTAHRSDKKTRSVLYFDPICGFFEPLLQGYWGSGAGEVVISKKYTKMCIDLS